MVCWLSMSFSMFWSFTHFPPVSLFPENCEPKKLARDVWFVIDMSGLRNDVKSENATFEHRSLFLVSGATLAIEQYPYVQYSVLALHCPKSCLRNHISFVNLVISKSSGWVFEPRYINALLRDQSLKLKVSCLSKPFDKFHIFKHKLNNTLLF